MSKLRVCLTVAFAGLAAVPAVAGKPDYCAAYARDFADAQTQDKALWQHKYDIALQSCLTEAKPIEPKNLAAKAPAAKPAPAPVKPVKAAPKEPILTAAADKPLPGSDAWNAYCAKKYTSFNAQTGTYKSFTGVERKCLVTTP